MLAGGGRRVCRLGEPSPPPPPTGKRIRSAIGSMVFVGGIYSSPGTPCGEQRVLRRFHESQEYLIIDIEVDELRVDFHLIVGRCFPCVCINQEWSTEIE